MNSFALLQTLALVPALASRPFLAAFTVAILPYLIRWMPALSGAGAEFPLTPDWLSPFITAFILGSLALIEIIVEKVPHLRAGFAEYEALLKGGVALLVSFSLINAEPMTLLQGLAAQADSGTGFVLSGPIGSAAGYLWPLVICIITWIMVAFRRHGLDILTDLVGDDMHKTYNRLSYLEDLGVIFGVILAILVPVLALVMFGFLSVAVYLAQKHIDHRIVRRFLPALRQLH